MQQPFLKFAAAILGTGLIVVPFLGLDSLPRDLRRQIDSERSALTETRREISKAQDEVTHDLQVGLGLEVVRDFVLRLGDLASRFGERAALRVDLPPKIARQAVESEERHDDESRSENRRREFQKWLLHWITAGKRSHLLPGSPGTCCRATSISSSLVTRMATRRSWHGPLTSNQLRPPA